MPASLAKYILCKIFSVSSFAGKGFLSIDTIYNDYVTAMEVETISKLVFLKKLFANFLFLKCSASV